MANRKLPSSLSYLRAAQSFPKAKYYSELPKKFPAFYGTRRFIAMLTKACH
jgi:hypothetical protein